LRVCVPTFGSSSGTLNKAQYEKHQDQGYYDGDYHVVILLDSVKMDPTAKPMGVAVATIKIIRSLFVGSPHQSDIG
jgi:hypothetical protein